MKEGAVLGSQKRIEPAYGSWLVRSELRDQMDESFFLFFFNFLFYIGAQLINNIMLVSGVQQSDQLRVSILFQIVFPFRLLHNIEQSTLCYTVSPCWLSILHLAVCTGQSQTPNLSLSHQPLPL